MLDTLPRTGARSQTLPGAGGALPAARAAVPVPPDPAVFADAVARCQALAVLEKFRSRLYECLATRADALFELTDAILCADHAVTSLVQLSLVPEFRRGHGALYDALAAGRIEEDKLASLLTATLPQLVDGDQGRAWTAGHDVIDRALLERALAGVPAKDAARVRDACARWTRLRFAVDATAYPRPDAGCSPGRGHVHNGACRCKDSSKTVPGWEYQFVAAAGHLRTAWAALIDAERTTPATRTSQTIRQVRNVLRRLHAAGNAGRGAPLFIFDAGYSAAALTAGLAGCPAHILVRLPAGSVFYRGALTWPGKNGRPGHHGTAIHCPGPADFAAAAAGPGPRGRKKPLPPNPEPDEALLLPDTPRYGTVRAEAWHRVHPLIHGDRGWFKDHWHEKSMPVLRGTLIHVTVDRLPDGRAPEKAMWLWHAGPGPLSCDELWRAYLARFDIEHAFKLAKSTLGLTAAKVRTPGQADRWVRLVMAAYAQLLIARPLTADLRRPWEKRPYPARPLPPGRVRRGFANIRPRLGTPAHVAKPTRPGPGRPQGSRTGPAPRYPLPNETTTTGKADTSEGGQKVKT